MTNINEIWVKIKDYEDLYEVSNLGRVRSFKRKNPKILKNFKPSGRIQVALMKNGVKSIRIKNSLINLGFSESEEEASKFYTKALEKLSNNA